MKKTVVVASILIIFSSAGLWGQDAGTQATEQPALITEAHNNKLNINMEEVELKEFVRSMSEILQKNFVIPSKLKGEVTIISPYPISREVAYSILESVLDVHGYSIVRSGPIYKIVESALSKTEGLDTRFGVDVEYLSGDKMITQVIPLHFITARDVQTMFQPLVSKEGYLVAHESSNTIILTDRVNNVNRLKKILATIDEEGSKAQIYHFRLQHASVEDLVYELSPLFSTSSIRSQIRSPERKPTPYVPSLTDSDETMMVADIRTNTLLVLCSPETYLQLTNLVTLLDVPTPRVRDSIHVIYLNNANAEELAEVLMKQATATTTASNTKREQEGQPLLQYIKITADKATNSLVITASPEDFLTLAEVIEKLDVRRSQVLVEALIIETSLDKTNEMGIEWNVLDPESDYYKAFGGTNLPIGTESSGALNQLGSDASPYSANNPAGLILGAIKGPVYWGKKAYFSIAALARALQADTDTNILLTPHIVTYDNQESEIIVGEERPYLKSSQTSTEGSVIRTFEFKDVGTTLRLTPHISQGNSIRLEIFTEIKNFVEQVDIGAITTTKRQVKTAVQVEDGQTIVLGGLIKEDKRKSRSMVPCLGNIWGLGWLFKSQKDQNQKTNLLIFLKPNVIKSTDDIQRITQDKAEEHRNTQLDTPSGRSFIDTQAQGLDSAESGAESKPVEQSNPGPDDEIIRSDELEPHDNATDSSEQSSASDGFPE
ncbi:type II secretion system secretin GspD [bacterium]|nr:type II secretion system secretin GspD [bacterium]